MTDAVPLAPQEFRPSWPAFHRRLLARMLWLGPLVVVLVLIASWPSLGLAFVVIGAGVLLAGLVLGVYFARSRVDVDDAEVRVRGPLRTRRWALRDIATLVVIPLPGSAPGAELVSLFAVSPVFERMFSLSGDLWESAELERIAEAMGTPVVRAPAGIPAAELKQRYPGTVGWTATHPWLLALLVTGVATLAMFLGVIITTLVLIGTGQVQLPAGS